MSLVRINTATVRFRTMIRTRRAAWLLRRSGAGDAAAREMCDAGLHAYIDDELDPVARMEIEAFLADHGDVARRVEAYRSQVIAVNAVFHAGDAAVPPDLARLAGRYARAVSRSVRIKAALGIVGLVAVLCMMSQAALGAAG